MQTKAMMYATLLLLGCVLPAWATPGTLPAPPVQERGTSPQIEQRQKAVIPPVPQRGQMLYENHCTSCHESVVHVRTRKYTKSLPELQARVLHWSVYLKLRWGKEEVEDVVNHLNRRFYKFEPR